MCYSVPCCADEPTLTALVLIVDVDCAPIVADKRRPSYGFDQVIPLRLSLLVTCSPQTQTQPRLAQSCGLQQKQAMAVLARAGRTCRPRVVHPQHVAIICTHSKTWLRCCREQQQQAQQRHTLEHRHDGHDHCAQVSDISTYTPLVFENFQNFAHRSNTNKTPSQYTLFCQCAHTIAIAIGTRNTRASSY